MDLTVPVGGCERRSVAAQRHRGGTWTLGRIFCELQFNGIGRPFGRSDSDAALCRRPRDPAPATASNDGLTGNGAQDFDLLKIGKRQTNQPIAAEGRQRWTRAVELERSDRQGPGLSDLIPGFDLPQPEPATASNRKPLPGLIERESRDITGFATGIDLPDEPGQKSEAPAQHLLGFRACIGAQGLDGEQRAARQEIRTLVEKLFRLNAEQAPIGNPTLLDGLLSLLVCNKGPDDCGDSEQKHQRAPCPRKPHYFSMRAHVLADQFVLGSMPQPGGESRHRFPKTRVTQ